MLRTRPLRSLAAIVTASALLLTACGDDDPAVEDTTPSETEAGADEGSTDAEESTGAAESPDEETTEQESATEEAIGSDDEEQTTAPSGPIVAEEGAFEITPPEGWVDVRDQVEQQVEVAVRDDEMTDDFFTNIVVASEEPIGDLEDSIEAAAEQVAGSDGDYELIDPIQIDGADAYGFVLTRTTGGVEVAQTQWWVEHGERLYVTTFSTAKTQQEASQPVMEEILSTWSWQD